MANKSSDDIGTLNFEKREIFRIVFTDGETKDVEGTRLVENSQGGVSVVDDIKAKEKGLGGGHYQHTNSSFVVISVPEHTLKMAYKKSSIDTNTESEIVDLDEEDDEFKYGEENWEMEVDE